MNHSIHRALYYLRVLGFRGLLSAVRSKLLNRPALLKSTRPGIRFPFYIRMLASDVSVYDQIFILREYDFETRKEPAVIIDAGANSGLTSIWFANRFPDSRIIAIEPEKNNFAILKKNIAPYNNITPVHGALWDENKEITLVDPGLGTMGYMTRNNAATAEKIPGKSLYRVKGMTIDRIMAEQGIEFIDILKIDIEGAEKEVFQDPAPWIDKVGALIIETHERMKPGCNHNVLNATKDFNDKWSQGNSVYLSRTNGCLKRGITRP
ncbi:MAG: FkbM family methyltransferase [Desulfobacterales bacterium]|nr:FkbM family methyltransferase [Desulfobacterales bacterium]